MLSPIILAKRKNTSPETLKLLANHPKNYISFTTIDNENTPLSALPKLVKRHPNFKKYILKKLLHGYYKGIS